MFNRKLYKICSILFIFIMFLGISSVFAVGVPNTPSGGEAVDAATLVAGNIWKTAEKIIQVLAVAAIVFAGLRYMFASADGKADIKKETVILMIGAVFVFGAVHIAGFVYKVAENIL